MINCFSLKKKKGVKKNGRHVASYSLTIFSLILMDELHFVHFLNEWGFWEGILGKNHLQTSEVNSQCWTGHRWWIGFQIRMQNPFLIRSPITWFAKSRIFLDTRWSLKILRKDYTWVSAFSSKEGRFTLVQATLSNLPNVPPPIFAWLLRLEKR